MQLVTTFEIIAVLIIPVSGRKPSKLDLQARPLRDGLSVQERGISRLKLIIEERKQATTW